MAEVEATTDNLNVYVGQIFFRLCSNLVLSRPDDHVPSSTSNLHKQVAITASATTIMIGFILVQVRTTCNRMK